MGFGCTYPCCVRRCAPNCTLSCCQNKVVIVEKNYPVQNNIVGYNAQQYNRPVIYDQPNYANNQGNLINKAVNYGTQPPVYQNQVY